MEIMSVMYTGCTALGVAMSVMLMIAFAVVKLYRA